MTLSDYRTFGLPLLVVLLLVSVTSVVGAEELSLRQEVVVETPPLTVSKVIKEDVKPELGSVTLGPLPPPGEMRYISQTYVKMKAASQGQSIPEIGGDVVRAQVMRAHRTVEQSELRDRILSLMNEKRALGKHGKVTVSELPKEIQIAPGSFKLRIGRSSFYRNNRRTQKYRFSVLQGDRKTASFRATVSVTIDQRVAVTVSRLSRGEKLSNSKIEWKERDVGNLRGIPITPGRNLENYVTTRSIRAGEILQDAHLKRPVVVEDRDRITIQYKKDGLVVTTEGKALEDGAIGDQILVENLTSEQEVSGKVKRDDLVVINS